MVQTRSESLAKRISGHDVPLLAKEQRGSATRRQQERLNLDILSLIAEYAHPRDLLNLACSCKYFQELLMDQSSTLVWKTARSKLKGLPACPVDLTEQEYANLAFCARCHGCGQYAGTVFWGVRRRYCSDCQVERLCRLSLCNEIVQKNFVLGVETIGIETPLWVDREQMEAFMDEYNHSSDKPQLLNARQEQLVSIRRHSRQCENWQGVEQKALRQERYTRIFEHLKQLGYEPEVEFFGRHIIRESWKSLFDTSKPLTDKEWDRIWPKWMEKMNNFRLQRLERTVYDSRRRSLVHEYDTYVHCPSADTPSFELLPPVADVARFPPFRDIIRAPEETSMSNQLFESAFAQLPEFMNEWRKKLDAEVAGLVQIPSQLSLNDTSGGQVTVSSSTTGSESSGAPMDKLHLACALFHGSDIGIFTYPNVFSTHTQSCEYPSRYDGDTERTESIRDRFDIEYVEEAPYVVHACGLDPNVATAEDMERRNARLQCLTCQPWRAYNWRQAVWHAASFHETSQARWRLIDDDSEEMRKILAAELADNREPLLHTSRCLLCRPRVGDELQHDRIQSHLYLVHDHHIERKDIKKGVHYMPVTTREHYWVTNAKVERGSKQGTVFEVDWCRIWW